MTRPAGSFGALLRQWRRRRGGSQLALALDAGISTRHLSFLETGRAAPSRMMVEHLAEALEVPLRERNDLLVAAGFSPAHRERALGDDALAPVRAAVERLLEGHEPYPALAVDGAWNLVAANAAAGRLIAGAATSLLQPPVNVLRLSLHPEGLAPRIVNLGTWRAHLLARLRRQARRSDHAGVAALLAELEALPARDTAAEPEEAPAVVPLRIDSPWGVLDLLSTTTVFGTALDVTAADLAIESLFPADAATAEALRRAAASSDEETAASQ